MGAMKEIATELEENGNRTDDVNIIATRSTIDGALLIIVDTREDVGRVRIDLNDGTIWDQDPELDVPEVLDGFAVVDDAGTPLINCNRCGYDVATGYQSLRAYVAAAKAHNCAVGGN